MNSAGWRRLRRTAALLLVVVAGVLGPLIWASTFGFFLAAIIGLSLGKAALLVASLYLAIPEIVAYLVVRVFDRELARVYGISAVIASILAIGYASYNYLWIQTFLGQ